MKGNKRRGRLQFSVLDIPDEPPDLVVFPGETSYVYIVPDVPDLYFYDGYWYRFHRGYWYWSAIYKSRWTYIESSYVPQLILHVQPDLY